MKKKLMGVMLLGVVAVLACACKGNSDKKNTDTTETTETTTETVEINYPDDVNDYYGCPNSKRIKKLNLKKSKMRV